jgi:hypothetical protein
MSASQIQRETSNQKRVGNLFFKFAKQNKENLRNFVTCLHLFFREKQKEDDRLDKTMINRWFLYKEDASKLLSADSLLKT